jgi:predicted CoA-binding protein
MDLKTAVGKFLEEERVAVVGVSRNPSETANSIFKHFRDNGYQAIPVNPAAKELEGATCYPSVKDIPDGVGAAMLVTTPAVSAKVAQDCVDAGVKWVWMHRSFGDSVSDEAVKLLRKHDVGVIPGGCPFMFLNGDPFHKAFRYIFQFTGRVPRTV